MSWTFYKVKPITKLNNVTKDEDKSLNNVFMFRKLQLCNYLLVVKGKMQ